jgi:hypothetical protein
MRTTEFLLEETIRPRRTLLEATLFEVRAVFLRIKSRTWQWVDISFFEGSSPGRVQRT